MTPLASLHRPADRRAHGRSCRRVTGVGVALLVIIAAGCTTGAGHKIAPSAARLPSTTAAAPSFPAGTAPAPAGALPAGPFTMTGDIATPVGDPEVYGEPRADAARITLPRRNDAGVITAFAVVGPATGAWIQVLVPTRPNGRMAWVPQRSVALTHTDLRVLVDLGGRRLQVQRAGTTVFDAPVAIGTTENPTPTGATYVTELIQNRDPNGSYGPYAYGLALFSPTLTEFAGGPGQVGIHGTNEPQLIGQRVSHGCVRLHNQDVRHLLDLQLPIGVPVFIT